MRMQKPLIKAVARTEHQAMLSEANRSLVPVPCHVANDEDSHAIPRAV
jgi:hypothetical protein